MTVTTTGRGQLVAVPLLLLAGFCAIALGKVAPLISPLLIALILGAITANLPMRRGGIGTGHGAATKVLLRVGVVLIGLRLPLQDIASIGLPGVVVIVVTVVLTFTVTCKVGDRLGMDRGLVTLIAAGFSICGASAIAAVESGIRRRDEHVALAIAMVTLFGSAMIVILPLTGHLLGLSARQEGVWAGASIHEVAQVVAAATTAGAAAVAIATTIKLGRVALLFLAYLAARRRDGDGPDEGMSAPILPWFVIGFLIAAAIRTADVIPTSTLDVADVITTLLLASAMFGLGLGMQLKTLFPVPMNVLGLSAIATLTAATVSLGLTVALF